MIRLLKDKKLFEEKLISLVEVGVKNLWEHFKDGALRTCDDVCGKMGGGSKGGGMKR